MSALSEISVVETRERGPLAFYNGGHCDVCFEDPCLFHVECGDVHDSRKVQVIEWLLSVNYDFKYATGLAEHGVMDDFWQRCFTDYNEQNVPEPRQSKIPLGWERED